MRNLEGVFSRTSWEWNTQLRERSRCTLTVRIKERREGEARRRRPRAHATRLDVVLMQIVDEYRVIPVLSRPRRGVKRGLFGGTAVRVFAVRART